MRDAKDKNSKKVCRVKSTVRNNPMKAWRGCGDGIIIEETIVEKEIIEDEQKEFVTELIAYCKENEFLVLGCLDSPTVVSIPNLIDHFKNLYRLEE